MTEFADEYAEQVKALTIGFGRAAEADIFFGSQPTRLKMFPGGECPMCHGYGGSHGPEQGFPSGWTCGTCAGSGKLGLVVLAEYMPYRDGHPNKDTKYERSGWTEPRQDSGPLEVKPGKDATDDAPR